MAISARILTTGGIGLDNVIAADGSVFTEQMGGNAAYSAVGASIWGAGVAMAGNIACNYPETPLRELASAGIGLGGVYRTLSAVTEAEWFLNEPDGSRLDHVHAPAGAFESFGFTQPLSTEDRARFAAYLIARKPQGTTFGMFRAAHPVTITQALASAPNPEIVHLAPERLAAQVALAQTFRERGAIVSLDPGAAVGEETGALARLLELVDIFLPSERELARMMPNLEPEAALAQLSTRTRAVLAVKLGARGALVFAKDRGNITHVPAITVTARDPVGAGDAFCGGFAAGYLLHRDPVEAARFATVSASFAVEGFGATHALGVRLATAEARRSIFSLPRNTEHAR